MRNIILVSILLVMSAQSFAALYSVSGKVKMIRLHQYLTDQSWDNHIWFCLDSTEVKGTCGTTSDCGGRMGLAVDKGAQPELYSTILAARISQVPVKVWVEDTFKIPVGTFCYAKIVDF